jgi:uncharacterized protein
VTRDSGSLAIAVTVPSDSTRPSGGRLDVRDDPELKYDSVRRLLRGVEQSVADALWWAASEPNAEPAWARARQVAAEYLAGRWRAGDLAGAKPEEAFFVRCDRSTMTQADLEAGRLVCLVGVAAVEPAEFVVFRIGQWTADARR